MRKLIFLSLLMLILLDTVSSYALQTKTAKDNETLLFTISNREFSRVFVSGDRIASVKGKEGSYELKEFDGQNDNGVIFIKPSYLYQSHPFSIFISTEQGRNYTLTLTPTNTFSENIQIKPLSSSKAVASRWEQNLPYTQQLIELMRQMINGSQPEGYAVVDLGKVKPKRLPSGLTMQLITVYRGGLIDGEIWKLKNTCCRTLFLSPRTFYQKNIRAVTLIDETLRYHDETYLYRVVDHE